MIKMEVFDMAYAVDLFCGAGGMSEGILQSGFHILFSNDVNSDVQKTYMNRHNQLGYVQGYNTHFHKGDIGELNVEFIWQTINKLEIFTNSTYTAPNKIDAIFGGPPCQGFSRAGRRCPDDPRNLLFREYLRIINQLRPRYVVMENVEGFNDTKFFGFKGVTGKLYDDGLTAPEILLDEFKLIGYNTLPPVILDASDYGVPQRRRRAIFMAYEDGEVAPCYPKPTTNESNRITVRQAIGDLIRDESIRHEQNPKLTSYQHNSIKGRTPNIHGIPIQNGTNYLNNELSKHLPHIEERFSLYSEGEDGNALMKRVKCGGMNVRSVPNLLAECSKQLDMSADQIADMFENGDVSDDMANKLLTKKTIRTRLYRDRPSLTVVTLPDDYISPFENRIFTVREMARLQSFDDSFEFLSKRTTGGLRRRFEIPQYSQVGNAVPPLLAKAIGDEILNALRRDA